MVPETRIDSLRQRHAELETMIDGEYARPMPDAVELKKMKLAKLRLKEELESLSNGLQAS